ncbi:fungal specific transcription factor domain-containing protein [Aspergillus lucknowensis]|uniref:C2H2-type domain-containing protein n=1 Tax=Aspergillus lucknowensis TaxID=176173 RepID=A0ABR4LT08_9EURO
MKTSRRVRTRKVQCAFCPKTFTRTEHLQRHLGAHGVGTAVSCPECGKEFMRKDVMKRHLSKCQWKRKSVSEGILPDLQSTTTPQPDLPAQFNVLHDELSNPETTIPSEGSAQSNPGPQFLLPGASRSESIWNDLSFDSFQFLFDPTFPDRDEVRLQQEAPSGFGVPCINVDPADTFNFLARISSKETASLEARYACSLHDRELAAGELDTVAGREEAGRWDGEDFHQTCVPTPLAQSGQEIVQQIKAVSEHSSITQKWTSQLEKSCMLFFSPRNIERFIRIYWTAWHPHYPVIHKPTFTISDAPTYLTAAMCIMGACFSPNENDRISAKLWLNSVEELVFTNPYFGDIILHDDATVNVREIVQLLQAAYCVSTFQISEGSKVSQRRIRRQRFNMLVSLARDLNLFNVTHRNLDRLREDDFSWASFIANEECIRTMLFIYIYDTGFTIFSNYPPRTRIQEMSLDMACPEACFQAASAQECFTAVKTWTAHPLWKRRMRLREIVETVLCTDISASPEMVAYLSHLGILNMWIGKALTINRVEALVAEAIQINTLLSTSTPLQPMRRAIHNWKAAWNQRYMIQDNFGLPKEEDRVLSRPEESWRRVGFFHNASEYWLLVRILTDMVEEQQRGRMERVNGVGFGAPGTAAAASRPYAPSSCDERGMVDLKNLIAEHHRRLTGFGLDTGHIPRLP